MSRAAICACLATGVCVGSVTLELWVMRGTCSWSALLLQISETSTLHWLQSAQVSWLGLCGPETSPWSAGTSLLASIECHAEQGRLAKPAVPRHLRRCTLCGTRALGDERHFVFDCPHFAHIRRQFRSLYQDADGAMQCFVWHKDQKAVCHCLAAILNVADDSNKDASS